MSIIANHVYSSHPFPALSMNIIWFGEWSYIKINNFISVSANTKSMSLCVVFKLPCHFAVDVYMPWTLCPALPVRLLMAHPPSIHLWGGERVMIELHGSLGTSLVLVEQLSVLGVRASMLAAVGPTRGGVGSYVACSDLYATFVKINVTKGSLKIKLYQTIAILQHYNNCTIYSPRTHIISSFGAEILSWFFWISVISNVRTHVLWLTYWWCCSSRCDFHLFSSWPSLLWGSITPCFTLTTSLHMTTRCTGSFVQYHLRPLIYRHLCLGRSREPWWSGGGRRITSLTWTSRLEHVLRPQLR